MLNTNVTNFRKNIFSMIDQTIKYNEPININTKNGNAILISEEDYKGLMETLYLCSVSGMEKDIVEGIAAPLSEFIPEEKVAW